MKVITIKRIFTYIEISFHRLDGAGATMILKDAFQDFSPLKEFPLKTELES
jgi:hypothetical protein